MRYNRQNFPGALSATTIILTLLSLLTFSTFVIKKHFVTVYTVYQKRPPFYFLNNCQKLTEFNDFWLAKS